MILLAPGYLSRVSARVGSHPVPPWHPTQRRVGDSSVRKRRRRGGAVPRFTPPRLRFLEGPFVVRLTGREDLRLRTMHVVCQKLVTVFVVPSLNRSQPGTVHKRH